MFEGFFHCEWKVRESKNESQKCERGKEQIEKNESLLGGIDEGQRTRERKFKFLHFLLSHFTFLSSSQYTGDKNKDMEIAMHQIEA